MKGRLHMNKTKKAFALLLTLAAVLLLLPGAGMREVDETAPYTPAAQTYYEDNQEAFESYEGFLRLDRDDVEAASGPLGNLRFVTEGEYELGEAEAKYDLDPDYVPSTEGLDTLNISASEQFSESQFHELADELRARADGKQIVIVDLRAESHCFLNGIPVSWQELNNWGNLFLTPEEIEADEAERFEPLLGQTVQAVGLPAGSSGEPAEIKVTSVTFERELVESEGFTYLRLDCTDHAMPTPAEIDTFIDFVKSIDMDDTWFHFHCVGGKGRTGTFMMLYDKMKNPQVSDKDIMYRHAQMGASYPIYTGSGANAPMYTEKAELTPLLYQYVEENCEDGYSVSWSEWLADRLAAPELAVHFIDVGQGDSELLVCDGHAMLIDGGNTDQADTVASYLEEQGIDHLDYLVCTHSHDDHCGGLPGALAAADVDTVLYSGASSEMRAFQSFVSAVEDTGLTITVPSPGDTFTLGDALIEVLGPINETTVVNDQSVVLRVSYGDVVFLLVGDAGITEMQDIMEAGYDVTCDVLKTGHHGSRDSTNAAILEETEPTYVIISCGVNNRFGLPDAQVLADIDEAGAALYRTDTDGTILCTTDGTDVAFRTTGKTEAASGEASSVWGG